jgi:hypothetical protein
MWAAGGSEMKMDWTQGLSWICLMRRHFFFTPCGSFLAYRRGIPRFLPFFFVHRINTLAYHAFCRFRRCRHCYLPAIGNRYLIALLCTYGSLVY